MSFENTDCSVNFMEQYLWRRTQRALIILEYLVQRLCNHTENRVVLDEL